MATIGGPNTVEDGLVFGYDVGLPFISSSKDTSYRFNKGVPITNVARVLTSWPTKARATVSLYSGPILPPIPGEDIYILSCSADNAGILFRDGGFYYGGGFGGSGNAQNTNLLSDRTNSYTPVGNNKFIYSLYVRPNENTLDSTAVSIDIGDRNSVNVQNVDDLTDWHKLTTNDSSGINSQYPYDFFDLAYTPLTIGNEVLISSIQILRTPGTESGSLTTPGSNNNNLTGSYIQHLSYGEERSFTNSILDLTGTTTIDLSYAGFNETQLSFDGTDDYAVMPYSSTDLDGDAIFSVEAIIKRTGTMSNKGLWGIGGDGSAAGINGYVHPGAPNKITIDLWGTATFHTGVDYPLDKYIHVVWVKTTTGFSTSTIIIYINGIAYTGSDLTVLRGSSHTPSLNTSTSGKGIVIGRVGPETSLYYGVGEMPLFKVYNQVLSSEKIKQNYNAINSRFGLT